MKAKIIPTIIITTVITSMLTTAMMYILNPPKKNPTNYYALTTTVTALETETDTVVVEDANGNEWAFYGIEDWRLGDICSMLMDTNGTETIYDDIIISQKYSGTTDNYISESMVDMDKVVYWEVTEDALELYYTDGTSYLWE